MTPKITRRWQAAVLAGALAATGSGAVAQAAGSPAAKPADTDALARFSDCGELTERMREATLPHVTGFGLSRDGGNREAGGGFTRQAPRRASDRETDKAVAARKAAGDKTVSASRAVDKAGVSTSSSSGNAASAKVAAGESAGARGGHGTGTNLQEQGVDEPDIAKTDGRTLLSFKGRRLQVFDVSGLQPVARGSLDLGVLAPSDLLLDGDRALVIGRVDDRAKNGRWHRLGLGLVDLADPDSPQMLAMQAITGRHVSTRMVDGVARVVFTSSPFLLFQHPAWRDYGSPTARARLAEENRRAVRQATAADWLPSLRSIDAGGLLGPARPLLDCIGVLRPQYDSGLELLTVLTLDLAAKTLSDAVTTSVVTSGDLVYASPDKLFVATTKYRWPTRSGQVPKVRTSIHSFDLTDRLRTPYTGSGKVDGFLLGRWAMSEHKGDLRVVTTTYDRKWRTESGVEVLRPQDDGKLETIGKVGGLGRNERVQAVRWFEEMAAVVTYRQVDPLYILDLSDPQKPVRRGALKVPGFSQYLHPVGEGRLLGIGQSADGWDRNGLQVSAFDISNPDAPTRTGNLQYGVRGSSSTVQSDARHFVYLPDTRTAVLPADIPAEWRCESDMTCEELHPRFFGLLAIRVGLDGTLSSAASWRSEQASAARMEGRNANVKALPLPGNRLAALDAGGLTVLDATDLTVRGFAKYPRAKKA